MSSIQPTITISSMSELTGVADPMTSTPNKKDEYVVVNQDTHSAAATTTSSTAHQSSCGSGNELKLSLHVGEHSVSPAPSTPPPSLPPVAFDPHSPNYNTSFTVVSDRDIIKAIPVGGLSSAAEAAQELELENGREGRTNDDARALFEKEHTFHFDSIMVQIIKSYGISLGWLKIVKPLVMEAARKVKTNVYSSDTMDIKEYVKVKKIPGGRRVDSALINGVVCTKNITHKKMKFSIRTPTVLLLKCAFEFQRKENQLSSFDTLQMQEEKYLKNLVARVKTFQPRVILVQKSVARLALDMFFHLDIVVAVNVKPSVMERVARSTQGDLLHSLDQLFFNVQLGTCGHFHLRSFALPGDAAKKTLMYFDQCDPRLGCTITLMGGSRRELKKVKHATLFGVFVAYNSQLETSFLIDEFAWLSPSAAADPHLLPNVEGYSSSPTTPEWPLHPSTSYPIEAIDPAELTRKLEALVPEHRVEKDLREAVVPHEHKIKKEARESSSSKSTPIMARSALGGTRSSNQSPLLSNTRSYSMSVCRNETLETVPDDENGMRSVPTSSRSVDDVRARNDPPSLVVVPRTPDPATLSQLGEREFERVLCWQILSITPGVKFSVPYLQTAKGFMADVRHYLPSVIYWSHQFLLATQASHQKTGRKRSPASTPSAHSSTPTLEMGLKPWTSFEVISEKLQAPLEEEPPTVDESAIDATTRSYRSVSEHPFTTAIFLHKANTNEMKAALADYRANSGLTNPSHEFFFPTALRASDYRQHLQNIFNKYQQFELASSSSAETERGGDSEREGRVERRGLDGGSLESSSGEGGTRLSRRRRAKRSKTPSLSGSGERSVVVSGEVAVTRSSEAQDVVVEERVSEQASSDGTSRRSGECSSGNTCMCTVLHHLQSQHST